MSWLSVPSVFLHALPACPGILYRLYSFMHCLHVLAFCIVCIPSCIACLSWHSVSSVFLHALPACPGILYRLYSFMHCLPVLAVCARLYYFLPGMPVLGSVSSVFLHALPVCPAVSAACIPSCPACLPRLSIPHAFSSALPACPALCPICIPSCRTCLVFLPVIALLLDVSPACMYWASTPHSFNPALHACPSLCPAYIPPLTWQYSDLSCLPVLAAYFACIPSSPAAVMPACLPCDFFLLVLLSWSGFPHGLKGFLPVRPACPGHLSYLYFFLPCLVLPSFQIIYLRPLLLHIVTVRLKESQEQERPPPENNKLMHDLEAHACA
jgi:hypothetical protein